MKDLGYITDEQYKTAYDNVEKGLQFSKGTLPGSSVKSYFIQAAIDEVVNDLVNEKNYSVEYAKNRYMVEDIKFIQHNQKTFKIK